VQLRKAAKEHVISNNVSLEMLTRTDCRDFACTPQVLVLDAPNGPASVLVDTLGRLLGRDLSVVSVETQADAVRALEFYVFDLVFVGVRADKPVQLTVLPLLHDQAPDSSLLVVARELSPRSAQAARKYGAREVVILPERAADLKALARHVEWAYLPPS